LGLERRREALKGLKKAKKKERTPKARGRPFGGSV